MVLSMESIFYFFIENPLSLQNISAKKIGNHFLSILKQLIPEECISELDKHKIKVKCIEFKELILTLPVPFHEDIFAGTLNAMYEYYLANRLLVYNELLGLSSAITLADEILPFVAEAISYLNIKIFSDSKPHYCHIKFIYPYIPNMRHLKCLDISNFYVNMEYSDYEVLILKAVSNMKDLEQLTLSYYYTDNIIKAIQMNCKKLMFMDLKETDSKGLTDACVAHLIECKNLQHLHMGDHNLSIRAYIQLIIHCPTLNLHINPTIMRNILTRLSTMWSQSVHCTHLHVNVSSENDVQNISNIFSQLTTLKIICNSRDTNFDSLSLLTQLQSISIEFIHFDNIKQLLVKAGKGLRKLELSSVVYVDVIQIADLCTNLRELTLNNCEYSHINNHQNFANRKNVFKHLNTLVCLFDITEDALAFLLSNCKYILCLKLSNFRKTISDECILNIINCNQLETLILGPNKIFSNNIFRLILTNKNLKKIIGLRYCDSLKKTEAKELISLNPHVVFKMFE